MKIYYLLGLLSMMCWLNQPVSYSALEWKRHVSEIENREKSCEEFDGLDFGAAFNKEKFNILKESMSIEVEDEIEKIEDLGRRCNSLVVKTLFLIDEIEDLLRKAHRESYEAVRVSIFFLEKKFKVIYTLLGEIDAINDTLESGSFSDEDLVTFGIKDTQKELNALKKRVDSYKKEFIKLKKIWKKINYNKGTQVVKIRK